MKNIITITDPAQVRVGDKAYFKNCDFGFTVIDVDRSSDTLILKVPDPLFGADTWVHSSLFDHATREVEVKEHGLPCPKDGRVHIYRDADDRLFVSQPSLDDKSARVWAFLGWLGRDEFNVGFPGWTTPEIISISIEFPLTEVEIVDKEEA